MNPATVQRAVGPDRSEQSDHEKVLQCNGQTMTDCGGRTAGASSRQRGVASSNLSLPCSAPTCDEDDHATRRLDTIMSKRSHDRMEQL